MLKTYWQCKGHALLIVKWNAVFGDNKVNLAFIVNQTNSFFGGDRPFSPKKLTRLM